MIDIPKYFDYDEMGGNDILTKRSFTLNGAGDSAKNPIVHGAPMGIYLKTNDFSIVPEAKTGITSPAKTTTVPLSQFPEHPFVYFYNGIAGTGPLDYSGKAFLRIKNAFLGNIVSLYERSFYQKPFFDDLIQIWANGEWKIAPTDGLAGCTTHCPIKFFDEWRDEFDMKRFGGIKYVSVFDANTQEKDLTQAMVNRLFLYPINRLHRLMLVRQTNGQVETHNIKLRFRTKLPTSVTYPGYYFDKTITLKTVGTSLIPKVPISVWRYTRNFWDEWTPLWHDPEGGPPPP